LEIEKLNDRLKGDEFLGKGSITVTEIISKSPSLCAVSDYARIHIDRRLTSGETKETAVKEIDDLIKGYDSKVELLNYSEKAYTGLEYGMEKYYPTWTLPVNHEVVKTGVSAYKKIFGKEPKVDKWTFSTNGIMTCGVYGIPTIDLVLVMRSWLMPRMRKYLSLTWLHLSAFYAASVYELCKC